MLNNEFLDFTSIKLEKFEVEKIIKTSYNLL